MTATFSENWITYNVDGATLADVADAISHLPEAGECRWDPSYTVDIGDDGLVKGVTITCPFTVQTPAWTGRSSASNEAGAEWDRWLGALVAHEQGHIAVATEVFGALAEKMGGLSPEDADRVFKSACDDAQAASNEYDARTNHGLNEGTVLDTSIE